MTVRIAEGRLEAVRGENTGADVVVTAPPPLVAAAVHGKAPLEVLDGLRVEGNAAAFERFIDFFHLPPKVQASGDQASGSEP